MLFTHYSSSPPPPQPHTCTYWYFSSTIRQRTDAARIVWRKSTDFNLLSYYYDMILLLLLLYYTRASEGYDTRSRLQVWAAARDTASTGKSCTALNKKTIFDSIRTSRIRLYKSIYIFFLIHERRRRRHKQTAIRQTTSRIIIIRTPLSRRDNIVLFIYLIGTPSAEHCAGW